MTTLKTNMQPEVTFNVVLADVNNDGQQVPCALMRVEHWRMATGDNMPFFPTKIKPLTQVHFDPKAGVNSAKHLNSDWITVDSTNKIQLTPTNEVVSFSQRYLAYDPEYDWWPYARFQPGTPVISRVGAINVEDVVCFMLNCLNNSEGVKYGVSYAIRRGNGQGYVAPDMHLNHYGKRCTHIESAADLLTLYRYL